MNPMQIFALIPRLLPLLPDIEKAITTIQKLLADPDLKAALATAQNVMSILEQAEKGN